MSSRKFKNKEINRSSSYSNTNKVRPYYDQSPASQSPDKLKFRNYTIKVY
ncbi:8586_t:CDS:2 [Cetraspora pellucida]|uniref:8586_t:CDS:1 n=1 Tax=Cetraspora pellucida TaxID=1433469 RepID=A0ACA9KE82_9GLOM|nr:8586_t:CDS:2 [Cetraspora pellucida]